MTKAHLTMKGKLNPSWELSSYDDGSIISTFAPDRGVGVNRPLIYTAAILIECLSTILLGLSTSDDFLCNIVHPPRPRHHHALRLPHHGRQDLRHKERPVPISS